MTDRSHSRRAFLTGVAGVGAAAAVSTDASLAALIHLLGTQRSDVRLDIARRPCVAQHETPSIQF